MLKYTYIPPLALEGECREALGVHVDSPTGPTYLCSSGKKHNVNGILMNYAIAEIAGRQFRIEEGAEIDVPRLKVEQGESVSLDKLLLTNWDGKVLVGGPYVDGASATAEVISHPRSEKIRVFKKKRRKGYRKGSNAREEFTRISIKQVKLPS